LNLLTVDPGEILKKFQDPPNGNPQEVYNSMLATAWIAAENRLTTGDVYACCGTHIIEASDQGPCAMGVDVKSNALHVVIGKKIAQGKRKVVWIGIVPQFEDLSELGKRFHVTFAAIDYLPETRKAREFQKSAGFPVYLIYYRDTVKHGERLDDEAAVMDVARTEICDITHKAVIDKAYVLPRRCPTVEEYAKQMSNIAKVLKEDEIRNRSFYVYHKLSQSDHYRHATNYFEIASRNLPIAYDDPIREMIKKALGRKQEEYNPLTYNFNN
jgi:hypothetical protein